MRVIDELNDGISKRNAMGWKTCRDESEKYNLYLASRDWAVKKEAVKKRSKGICERCNHHPARNVHHLTYIRKYNEKLADLAHWCVGCHEFEHAKRQDDPRLSAPVKLLGKVVKSVYLAGKITGATWRDEIIDPGCDGGWSGMRHDAIYHGQNSHVYWWEPVHNAVSIPDGRRMHLTGPFWRSLDGANGISHCLTSESSGGLHCWGLTGKHAFEIETDMQEVFAKAVFAIQWSDFVFAWIDSIDCFGTLNEIGIAKGAGVPVVVAVKSGLDTREIWFSCMCASQYIEAASPKEAWEYLWSNHFKRRHPFPIHNMPDDHVYSSYFWQDVFRDIETNHDLTQSQTSEFFHGYINNRDMRDCYLRISEKYNASETAALLVSGRLQEEFP